MFPCGPGGLGTPGDTDAEDILCLPCLESPGQVQSRAAKPFLPFAVLPAAAKPLTWSLVSRPEFASCPSPLHISVDN